MALKVNHCLKHYFNIVLETFSFLLTKSHREFGNLGWSMNGFVIHIDLDPSLLNKEKRNSKYNTN